MCNFLSRTDRYVYLKVQLPAVMYDRLLGRFGGEESKLLRELRLRWEGGLNRYWSQLPEPPPSSSPSGTA